MAGIGLKRLEKEKRKQQRARRGESNAVTFSLG
jgi:hypothetical protein